MQVTRSLELVAVNSTDFPATLSRNDRVTHIHSKFLSFRQVPIIDTTRIIYFTQHEYMLEIDAYIFNIIKII